MVAVVQLETEAPVYGEITQAQIDEGKSLLGERKRNQFRLGDLVLEVCGIPGRGRPVSDEEHLTISEFADAIGAVTSTLNDWRRFSNFYNHDMRAEFERLSYFKMRTAMNKALRECKSDIDAARLMAVKLLRQGELEYHTANSFVAEHGSSTIREDMAFGQFVMRLRSLWPSIDLDSTPVTMVQKPGKLAMEIKLSG